MSTHAAPDGLTIRPFDESERDFVAAVAIWNALWPDEPNSVEGMKYRHETRNPRYLLQQVMVELDGDIVGMAIYREPFWSYAPGKYDIQIRVLPEHQRKGIGSMLYDYVMDRLNELPDKPVNVHADARENQPHSVKFLTDRGFEMKQRQQVSRLDVGAFGPARFARAVAKFEQSGFRMKTLVDFQKEDPDALSETHEKFVEFFQDAPFFEDITDLPYEQFIKELESPARLEGAFLIAFDGDEIVGMTSLWKRLGAPGMLGTGLTAVARSHRRRGIATALKVRAIEFAKDLGVREISTDNEENNPMYDLNVRLGFRPVPAWLLFRKLLGDGAGEASAGA